MSPTRWRRFLYWASGKCPVRVVMAPAEGVRNRRHAEPMPLFERYLAGRGFGLTAFLHHYLRSDPDGDVHNHPWRWAIVMPLAAGYWERRPARIGRNGIEFRDRWRRPFVPYLLRETDFHRLILPPGRTNWSLFIHGPRTQGWGFLRHAFGGDPGRPQAIYFDPMIDRTSSAALGREWSELAKRGNQIERAAP